MGYLTVEPTGPDEVMEVTSVDNVVFRVYDDGWREAGDALERLAIALAIPYGNEVRGDASLTVGKTTVRIADLLNALADLAENVDG